MKRKFCKKCKKRKSTSHFHRDRASNSGYKTVCKRCQSEADSKRNAKRPPGYYKKRSQKWRKDHPGYQTASSRAWRKKNSERVYDHNLKAHYGLPLGEYAKMLAKQNGKCAICGGRKKGKKRLHLDHRHGTRKIRGPLCNNCNLGLGHFKENITALLSAIKYLRKHKRPD